MEGLLQYIDQIDQSVADAEINVIESLIQSYDKSITIITEASDDTDFSAFDIFQEGEKWDKFKEDTKAPMFGKKGEGLIKRILMILPRLIQKFVALIRRLVSRNKSFEQKMDKDIQQMKQQATTVVAEPITDEQAKIIATRAKELEKKKHEEMQAAYDKSAEEVKQSSRDLEATKNRTMDSISARHAAFWQSYDELMKSLYGSDVPTHSETMQSINNIADSIQKIDKKNPGFADQVLEELGAPPRKKTKLEDTEITVRNTTFFGAGYSVPETTVYDEDNIGDPVGMWKSSIPDVVSRDASLEEINKYNRTLIIVRDEYNRRNENFFQQRGTRLFKVKYSEALHVFEEMKRKFEESVVSNKNLISVLESNAKWLSDQCERLSGEANMRAIEIAQRDKTSVDNVKNTDAETKDKLERAKALQRSTSLLTQIVSLITNLIANKENEWNINYKVVKSHLEAMTPSTVADIDL